MRQSAGLVLATVATLILLSACKEAQQSTAAAGSGLDAAFDTDTIVVINDAGDRHTLNVYLAIAYDQKKRGLMFVRELPENSGMLFVYDDTDYHSMWMKNTYISLDLIFARSDGSVSSIIHDTTPLSLKSQGSVEPVNYVLELNGGSARRLNIGRKSKILWDGFESARDD